MNVPTLPNNSPIDLLARQIQSIEGAINQWSAILEVSTAATQKHALASEVAKVQLDLLREFLNGNIKDQRSLRTSIKEGLRERRRELETRHKNYLATIISLTDSVRNGRHEVFCRALFSGMKAFKHELVIDEDFDYQVAKSKAEQLEETCQMRREVAVTLIQQAESFEQERVTLRATLNELKNEREELLANPQITDIFEAAALDAQEFLSGVISREKEKFFLARLVEKSSLKKVQPNLGFTVLHVAAFFNSFHALGFLLQQGADPKQLSESEKDLPDTPIKGYQALHFAAKNGSAWAVNSLIRADAPIDGLGAYYRTPLHMAVYNNHIACATLLLNSGANPNAHAELGLTPLHYAVTRINTEMVTLLLNDRLREIKMDVNEKDAHHYTPLSEAVRIGLPDIIRLITEHHSFKAVLDEADPNSIYALLSVNPRYEKKTVQVRNLLNRCLEKFRTDDDLM